MVEGVSKTSEVASVNRRIQEDYICCLLFRESRWTLYMTLRKVFICALNAGDFTSEADACIYVILPLMVACANPENKLPLWTLPVALRCMKQNAKKLP